MGNEPNRFIPTPSTAMALLEENGHVVTRHIVGVKPIRGRNGRGKMYEFLLDAPFTIGSRQAMEIHGFKEDCNLFEAAGFNTASWWNATPDTETPTILFNDRPLVQIGHLGDFYRIKGIAARSNGHKAESEKVVAFPNPTPPVSLDNVTLDDEGNPLSEADLAYRGDNPVIVSGNTEPTFTIGQRVICAVDEIETPPGFHNIFEGDSGLITEQILTDSYKVKFDTINMEMACKETELRPYAQPGAIEGADIAAPEADELARKQQAIVELVQQNADLIHELHEMTERAEKAERALEVEELTEQLFPTPTSGKQFEIKWLSAKIAHAEERIKSAEDLKQHLREGWKVAFEALNGTSDSAIWYARLERELPANGGKPTMRETADAAYHIPTATDAQETPAIIISPAPANALLNEVDKLLDMGLSGYLANAEQERKAVRFATTQDILNAFAGASLPTFGVKRLAVAHGE